MRFNFLPDLRNKSDVAKMIGIDLKILLALMRQKQWNYKIVSKKKRMGERILHVPNYKIKSLQAWVLRRILDLVPVSEYATAYCKKRGISWNLGPHRSNRYFVKLDVKDFFPSINYYRVRRVFVDLGYKGDVSELLANIATVNGFLPQGGVSSPSISNLIMLDLDKEVGDLVYEAGGVYTRYCDDLIISSNNPLIMRGLLRKVSCVIRSYGFEVNRKKTSMAGPRSRVVVTGYVKDSNSAMFGIGRRKYRMLRAEIHSYKNGKEPKHYKTEESLRGVISTLKDVNFVQYKKLISLMPPL